MRKLLLILLFSTNLCFAGELAAPTIDTQLSTQTQQYLQQLYLNIDNASIITTDPNGSRQGRFGDLVIYNNSGTYSVYVNTSSPNGTAWSDASATPAPTGMQYSDTRFKVGVFTHNLASAGTQAITVGFSPKSVIFSGAVDGNANLAIISGFDDGTSSYCISHDWNAVYSYHNNISLYCSPATGAENHASISSLDTNGFTLTWAIGAGSPTGTMTIIYTAYR